jgi:hypothetical protein
MFCAVCGPARQQAVMGRIKQATTVDSYET